MKQVNLRLLLAIIILFSSISTSFAQPNLGAYPTILDFRLPQGQSQTQAVHLTNNSADKIQLRAYLNDWVRDSTGGHQYYRADTLPQSCSRFVTLDKNFVELLPGQSTDLTVTLAVPDSAAASMMRWSMLFIETVEEQNKVKDAGTQAAVRNVLRIGVHIYQTPPAITSKEIKIFDLLPVAGTNNVYKVLCQNTGQTMIDCKSYIELNSLTDGNKIKLDPIEFPMFPLQRRYVMFELPPSVPKGKYSALAVLDGGEDIALEAVEGMIEVK
ncbi:MAG: hypothetical protein EOP49_12090 [Sphingobacteriales bacterium]|nr:MAG: hypothetical protein EOP49_12090 [Sphingobacteriales bacterium]